MGLLVLSTAVRPAQTPSDFAGNPNPLFQGILARPSDLNNTLQYAAGASAGDIESAISTYEQLLFYNPKLSRVRFELGVLYFQLGSYEMARSYFNRRCRCSDITPDLQRTRARPIAIIDKKLQVDQFTGYVQTGLALPDQSRRRARGADGAGVRPPFQQQLLLPSPIGIGSARSG